ncbi:hypothetical protein I302_101690 [Kwoniella bestiolae CBS 10118]|uniref:Uncharacterized protein n=1 Tax=Kwoniella bestiolae CBS 10118 TaxID=1296100 RepID=A0AAJ8K2I9_9TREE
MLMPRDGGSSGQQGERTLTNDRRIVDYGGGGGSCASSLTNLVDSIADAPRWVELGDHLLGPATEGAPCFVLEFETKAIGHLEP